MKRISVLMTALLVMVCTAGPLVAADPNPRVKFETTEGDILLELDAAKAPITVENFLRYVKEGFYNGLIFHRVIPNFMIQGGGYTKDVTKRKEGMHPPIKIESKNGLKNDRGTIAMARTADPNSATCEFFINVVDNDRLNFPAHDGYGYAVFGKVVEGLDTVDKIRYTNTISHPRYGAGKVMPEKPIVITKASVLPPAKGATKVAPAKPSPKKEAAAKPATKTGDGN